MRRCPNLRALQKYSEPVIFFFAFSGINHYILYVSGPKNPIYTHTEVRMTWLCIVDFRGSVKDTTDRFKNHNNVPGTRKTVQSFVVETIAEPGRRLIKPIQLLNEITAKR